MKRNIPKKPKETTGKNAGKKTKKCIRKLSSDKSLNKINVRRSR